MDESWTLTRLQGAGWSDIEGYCPHCRLLYVRPIDPLVEEFGNLPFGEFASRLICRECWARMENARPCLHGSAKYEAPKHLKWPTEGVWPS